jgi:DNA-binding HxlR family transcriptional regulator
MQRTIQLPPTRQTAMRSYDQYCPGARALDIVGRRWTLLIVRELMAVPKRYTDLLAGLPGIGPNVLAARLHEMEAFGLIQRRALPPPAASTVYELTDLGQGLIPVIRDLRRWGTNFLGPPTKSDRVQVPWLVGAMMGAFRPGAARGVCETYEFRIDGLVFQIRVDDDTVELEFGSASEPDLRISTDKETLAALISRQLSPSQAVRRGKAQLQGDLDVAERWVEILGLPVPTAQPG